MTYYPENERIIDQAFGRTSRISNIGTTQIIFNSNEFCEEEIEEKRNELIKTKSFWFEEKIETTDKGKNQNPLFYKVSFWP